MCGPTSTSTTPSSAKPDLRTADTAIRILGLDPGARAAGWGVLERRGRGWALAAHGVLRPRPGEALPGRLHGLHAGLLRVIERFLPLEAAVEDIFHARNSRSALVLGQARGVLLLGLCQRGVPVHSYPAATVKKAVGGSGAAGKREVRRWVCRWLGASPDDVDLDASDALAVALCHAQARSWRGAVERARRSLPPQVRR
jgi:crossover junction endodeoxyribonuclease RuvC